MRKRKKTIIVLFICVMIAPLIFDFQDVSARKNKTVPEKKRHELSEGGPYKGIFETTDLKLDYEYTREPGRLTMSGVVKFRGALNLDDFKLGANLINAEGKIVHKDALALGGGRRQIAEIPFEKEIKIPDDTWGVAFSYSGTVRGIGEGAGSPTSFWQTPF